VDPHTFVATWTLHPAEYLDAMAAAPDRQLHVRLVRPNTTPQQSQPVNAADGVHFLNVGEPRARLGAEIGTYGSDGRFIPIATAPFVEAPPDRPADLVAAPPPPKPAAETPPPAALPAAEPAPPIESAAPVPEPVHPAPSASSLREEPATVASAVEPHLVPLLETPAHFPAPWRPAATATSPAHGFGAPGLTP
jgi:hypothetical protein